MPDTQSSEGPNQDHSPSVGRRALLGATALVAMAPATARAASAAALPRPFGAAWHAAPTLSVGIDGGLNKPVPIAQTARLIIHPLAGGSHVRLRFANLEGVGPLVLGPVWVGLRDEGARIRPGSNRPVRFRGRTTVTIPRGEIVVSDIVRRPIRAFEDVAVSFHVPLGIPNLSGHQAAFQTSFLSMPGDHARVESAKAYPIKTTSWPFLCGVDVSTTRSTIVALGDSITDCAHTTVDANRRWPDLLARRLAEARRLAPVGVVNAGIAANQILRDALLIPNGGDSALHRFQRDVLDVPGVSDVIVHEGTNDIGLSGANADQVLGGLLRLAARSRAAGLRVHATTILPAGRATLPGHSSPLAIRTRNEVNSWLRRHWSTAFDSLTDLATVLADPAAPNNLDPRYDGGDGLHPNDRGTLAMARAFDLDVLVGASPER